MTDHTPEFHAALERMTIVARLVEEGTPYGGLGQRTAELGVAPEQAELAALLLPEACSYVLAEEMQIQMAQTLLIRTGEREQELKVNENNDFRAAHLLAYNLRHGGRNNLFVRLIQPSAFLNVLNTYLNGHPDRTAADLVGAQFQPLILSF